ncbi:MAG: hypothetical protein AB7F67_03930 [Rhodospirillaceae bacterium]
MRREAIDVQRFLYWAFHKQQVENADTGWDLPRGWLGVGDSARRAAEVGALGAIIDTSRNLGHAVHPDALLAERAVGQAFGQGRNGWPDEAGRRARALVLEHARCGGAPWWCAEAECGRYRPVTKANGKLVKLWDESRNAIGCEVAFGGGADWHLRRFARDQYAAWWHGLARVAMVLKAWDGKLAAHTVTGPAAPADPWAAPAGDSFRRVDFTKKS